MCRLCRAEGRRYMGHTLSSCGYIANAEKKDMVKAFKVDVTCDDEEQCDDIDIPGLDIDDE